MNQKVYKLMNWPLIEEIIYSESAHPKALLGPHKSGSGVLYQCFYPDAVACDLVFDDGKEKVAMDQADEAGYFATWVSGKQTDRSYRYIYTFEDGNTLEMTDAYAFGGLITQEDEAAFASGIHYTIYKCLGAHLTAINGVKGVHFGVWAPNAERVSVVGDFNNWDGRIHQMEKLSSGIFELFIPGVCEGDCYKFEIKIRNGLTFLKADPYGFGGELRPDTASVVRNIEGFVWEDRKWIENRTRQSAADQPMSVYELYLGSFLKPQDGMEYANYRDIADALIPYVKEMGYTHIELMPVMEHPLDASWGYQTIGYYAPTARYGTPKDFMYFINECHKADIAVILDWVPAHFPRDTHGLSGFDGTCLYEHQDPRQGAHPHWGTLIYNYGRKEVSNYLIANALFWAEQYHADGIRMDAVASMLYLDYGKNDGEWIANIYGGNENLDAIEFIKHLNSIMKKRNPGVLTIAEESTAFPLITGDLNEGGLGFDLKWNMGWMNDYLRYIAYDPFFRSYHHNELTFSMIYAYSEKFMLVFSHDEVVHGKSSMIGKMPGSIEEKFAGVRLTYAYMMAHPGKKLLFMGQDLAEFDEWNEKRIVEWELEEYPHHEGVRDLVRDLNALYAKKPALYELDHMPEGFEWINCIDADENVLVFMRKSRNEKDFVVCVANFSGVEKQIGFGVPYEGGYKEIFNSDDIKYGGNGVVSPRVKKAKAVPKDGRPYSVSIKLSPLSVSILEYRPPMGGK